MIGLHKVPVALHPEIEVSVNVAVARSQDEADRLLRGEDITLQKTEAEQDAEAAKAAAEAFFEPEALEAQKAAEKSEPEAEAPANS
jgi:large subunit ribosomal protein L9